VLLAAILRTRPIYHSSDAAIRGHVFCSFLALMLRKELTDLCQRHGLTIEWADLLRDLDRLQEITIAKDGKRISTRTAVAGQVGSVFAQIDRLAGELLFPAAGRPIMPAPAPPTGPVAAPSR
jgi:hypothetical protein